MTSTEDSAQATQGSGHSTGGSMLPMPAPRVRQLRLVVEAADFDEAVRFYRDVLGMEEHEAFATESGDDRVVILEAGRATLEIANPTHKRVVDEVETDGVTGSSIRVALEVDDAQSSTDAAVAAGAELLASARETPWRSLNSRLSAPARLEVTLFQELEDEGTRTQRPGFGTDDQR